VSLGARRIRFVIAAAGGLLFAASLAYFAWRYFGAFGTIVTAPIDARAIVFDTALFSIFAMHHSVLARTGAKRRVLAVVPADLERSSFVWIASLLFIAVCAWWQPVSGVVWRVDDTAAWAMRALSVVGAWLTLRAAAILDILDLAGARPFFAPRRATPLTDRGPYGLVRHPIYLAWLLLVWPVPVMTGTRLVFAVVSTAYLAAAIPLEERGLRAEFGEAYTAYARKVKWRMVPGVY